VSHYIDTPQASYEGSSGLSTRQRWGIVTATVVAIALGVAALAIVNTTETPLVEQVSQPVVQSYAGVDDLATRSVAAVRSYAGADDLATRLAVPVPLPYAGSDDLATRSDVQAYAEVDDLATR